ncbi:hypothetical protein LUZ63_024134 [Rhynchospora breviuscula]|uniref:Uncharacterized protein n=1 Tax=Rhynchospora breviuscula TaxID=2022672 RepID=A0A9P9Z2Z6_9POAL|nr:hypothetical protein LUZ63_024134 [Rhynchospora breviuscula]
MLTFEAQELIGGFLSLLAVAMVTWMIFWMQKAGRTLKAGLEGGVEKALRGGVWALVAIGFVSVAREGVETTLLLWSMVQSFGATPLALVGAVLGLVAAVVLGWLIARGMLRLNLSRFFTWTGAFLIVVAAGVLAYAIHDLQEGGALPGPFGASATIDPLTGVAGVGWAGFPFGWAFDLSGVVAPSSGFAAVLQATVGFMPQMTWLQVIAWIAYVAVVVPLFVRGVRANRRPRAAAAPRAGPRHPRLRRVGPCARGIRPPPERSIMNPTRLLAATAAAGAAVLVLSGCVAKTDAAATGALTVTSTADRCDVSAPTASSGTLAFDVVNEGDQTTEFYLLASDGLRIVGEVENVAPGASRSLTVTAQPGDYFTVCKPGMVGDGVGKAGFTVVGDAVAVDGADAEQKQQAIDLYAAFVKDQVGQLLPAVQTFVSAYESGDDQTARDQYPRVRAYYERIEPIAEALGDLDPRIDYREVDAVAEGLAWTGFPPHREGSLGPRAGRAQRRRRDARVEGLDSLHARRAGDTLNAQGVAGISNGAIALLDEVATGKISGEEDWWSHTDLYDFAANVEGSKMAFSLVRDFAESKGDKGAALVTRIDTGYADLEAALATYGSLDAGFVSYGQITDADKRQLTDLINALAEPLSQLTVTVLE